MKSLILRRTRKTKKQAVSSARKSALAGSIAMLAAAALSLGSASTAKAANRYWDPFSSSGTSGGGAGTWDLTTMNPWWDPIGAADVAWSNAGFDIAIFGGTAGTVTLGVPITAGGLTFNTSGYTITGSTLTLKPPTGSSTPVIAVNGIGSRVTISSILAGPAGFAKTGDGALVLTNNGNTFSGDLVINAGSLVITNAGQLGTGMTAISVNGLANTGSPGLSGGQLVLQGGITGAGLTISREISVTGRGPGAANSTGGLISIGNNTLSGNFVLGSTGSEGRAVATHGITTITGGVNLGSGASNLFLGNGNWILSGVVTGFDTGTDRFIKTQTTISNTLWLQNANNNFAETLRIDNGSVRVSDNGALGLNAGARSVDLNGGFLEVDTDAPNFGTRNIYSRGNTNGVFVNRALGGTGLNQTVAFGNFDADNATFTINGRDGYNFTIGGSTGSGTNMSWSGAANLTVNNNSSGTVTLDMNIQHDSETTARTFSVGGNSDTVITGVFLTNGSSNPAFAKNGIGMLTLTNTATSSTDTNVTTINAGTLTISSFGVLPTGTLNIGNATTTSGALNYAGAGETSGKTINLNTTTVNVYINANGSGALILNGTFNAVAGAKTLVLGGASTANNEIQSGLPAATTNIQKIGTGTWQLSGANLFTGTTTVSGGTLNIQDTFSGSSRNVLPDAGAVIFNVDTFTQAAGGTFSYVGDSGVASAESVGALTATAGHGIVQALPTGGGSAALTFGSLGARTVGGTVNVSNTGTVKVTGTSGFLSSGIFFNGSDFAFADATTTLRAPVYTDGLGGGGGDVGFVTSATALTAALDNQITGSFSNGAVAINSLQVLGAQTLTLTGNLTVGTAAGSGIIQTGGSGLINGAAGNVAVSAAANDLVVRVDGSSNTLEIARPITTSTAGLTKSGAGTLILSAANTYSGTVSVNEGTLRMASGGLLGATNIGLTIRQGATFDLNGINVGTVASGTNSVNAFNGAGTITNSAASGTASLRFGNSNSSGLFTGLIQNGATAGVELVKSGSGTVVLSGLNTFTGPVTIIGGNLDTPFLADIGVASGIGKGDSTDDSTNAASIVLNGGALRYVGTNSGGAVLATQSPSVSTNRLFTLAGNGTIASFGSFGNVTAARSANNAALIFSNTADIAFSGAATARTLTLDGDSSGDNEMRIHLVDNGVGALSVTKVNASGLWILNPATANTYSGATTITAGQLQAIDGMGLSSNSNLVLGGGVFQSSGTFTRNLGTFGGQVSWTTNGSGGFAASYSKLTVNMGGTVAWGSGGIGNGTGTLILSSATAFADVEIANDIDLNVPSGTVTRTIQVDDNANTGLDFATISGVIGNSGGGTANLSKTGGGTLILGGANTYNGNTLLTNGSVVVNSIGAAGDTATSFGTNVSGGSILMGSGGNTVNLVYVGPGETVTRPISFVGTTGVIQIDSSGSGPLVLTNVADAATNQFTLQIRGTNADLNTISANLTDSTAGSFAFRVLKTDGGVWVLTGTNTYSGGTRVDAGLLGLGASSLPATLAPAGLTANAVANTTTVTTSDTSALKVGMYVNGIGFGYGDVITAITNSTTFSISTARTVSAGTQMIFGGLLVSNGEIFATDSAGLTTSQPVLLNNNTAIVFGGANNITLNGNVYKLTGANDLTFSNNLEGGAIVTVNGNYVNLQNAAATRNLNVRGYGSTVWNGVIQDFGGTSLTRLDIRMADSASFTLADDNKGAALGLTGGVLLGQGTLIVANAGALGPAANIVILDGGVLTSTIDLTGANAIQNRISLQGNQATINGSQNIELAGTVALENNGGNRFLLNNLDPGKTLTISGGVNLSNDNTAGRILTIRGTGLTTITGVVANGGTGAESLAFSGLGSLILTNNETATGSLTVNRSLVVLSGANGSWNNGTFTLQPTGILRLDNSGGNNVLGRLSNTGTFAGNGGTLDIIAATGGSTHTAGALTLNSVQSYITVDSTLGGVDLTFAAVNFANSGSSLNLSGISSLGTTNKVKFTTFVGSANTPVINGMMPRVFLGGTDFAAYDVTNGVIPFTAYNVGNNLNTAAATDTLDLTANSSLTANRTINALKLDNAAGLTVGGSAGTTLTIGAGALLNSVGNNTLSTPIVNFGTTAYIQVAGGTTLTVDSTLTGGTGLAKSLPGTLQFDTRSFITSTHNLLNGTVKLVSGGVDTFFTNQLLNINNGATLDLNGGSQYIGNFSDPGVLAGAGGEITNSSITTGTFATNASTVTVASQITGNLNFAKMGNTTLTLLSAQTYTGSTNILGGGLTLQDDATILNTSEININAAQLYLNNNAGLQIANYGRISSTIP
ncbi:MAG: autotransporter-associated beta strand repeat-containing protein, partial [Chthoniobacteraceae bacterium]